MRFKDYVLEIPILKFNSIKYYILKKQTLLLLETSSLKSFTRFYQAYTYNKCYKKLGSYKVLGEKGKNGLLFLPSSINQIHVH